MRRIAIAIPRRVRSFFQSASRRAPSAIFRDHTRAFETAVTITRCYYAGLLFIVLLSLDSWARLRDRAAIEPLWPLSWLQLFEDTRIPLNVLGALLILGGAVAVCMPERRWARFLAFAGIFSFDVLRNSFGKIGHSYHVWVLTSFVLIFLPNAWGGNKDHSRLQTQRFLLVFWSCQALVLLTYSMAGLGKVLGIVTQTLAGEVSGLAPEALAIHVADRLLQTESRSLLGSLIVEHPWLGWLPMLSILYIQFFAFWIAFRPSLQRVWAVALIAFHLGSYLTITVHFPRNCFLLALLFLRSPFDPSGAGWRERLSELPILGLAIRRIR